MGGRSGRSLDLFRLKFPVYTKGELFMESGAVLEWQRQARFKNVAALGH